MRPEAVSAPTSTPEVDGSMAALLSHWRLVVADLMEIFHLDLYDPAVRGRPCQGIRTAVFALLDMPDSRLRRALTIRR